MDKLSMANEDYLEAIAMLGGTTENPVRSIDIAKHMNVSKTSITKAVNALKENGLVEQPPYGDVTLTEKGAEYAAAVYKRHRYLRAFLVECLSIPEEVAEEEACKMEHAISDDSFVRWVNYIEGLGIMEDKD